MLFPHTVDTTALELQHSNFRITTRLLNSTIPPLKLRHNTIFVVDDRNKFKSAVVDPQDDTISFFYGLSRSVDRERGHLSIRFKYEDEFLFPKRSL